MLRENPILCVDIATRDGVPRALAPPFAPTRKRRLDPPRSILPCVPLGVWRLGTCVPQFLVSFVKQATVHNLSEGLLCFGFLFRTLTDSKCIACPTSRDFLVSARSGSAARRISHSTCVLELQFPFRSRCVPSLLHLQLLRIESFLRFISNNSQKRRSGRWNVTLERASYLTLGKHLHIFVAPGSHSITFSLYWQYIGLTSTLGKIQTRP